MSLVSLTQPKRAWWRGQLSAQTIDGSICIALTSVGSIGLSYPETAARLGRFVSKHTEVPFGTLVSLAELFGGVALGWYWLGFFAAIAVWPAGSLVAFILTIAMGGHVQLFWLVTQSTLLLSGSSLLFELVRASIYLR